MVISDFRIGQSFQCDGKTYRCTDVGTRTIVAIKIDLTYDPSWFVGPPYAVMERVFDEHDQKVCEVLP